MRKFETRLVNVYGTHHSKKYTFTFAYLNADSDDELFNVTIDENEHVDLYPASGEGEEDVYDMPEDITQDKLIAHVISIYRAISPLIFIPTTLQPNK